MNESTDIDFLRLVGGVSECGECGRKRSCANEVVLPGVFPFESGSEGEDEGEREREVAAVKEVSCEVNGEGEGWRDDKTFVRCG